MTTSAHILNPLADTEASVTETRADVKVWAITCLVVAAIFLLLENPYWVPGGDSEVYLGSAINLAKGTGYLFNGQPTKIAPPGWPFVLAFVLKFVSPTFLALKLVTLGCMTGALATFYWVLRRFASPATCSLLIVLSALVSHVYSLTFWLHSDALFTLITALTILLSLQINEGRAEVWRIALLLVLVAAGIGVRYAGIINVVLLAPALVHGQWKPKLDRTWVTSVLVVAMTIGSFFAIRWAVHKFAPARVAFEATAQVDSAVIPPPDQGEGSTVTNEPSIITGTAGHSSYATRVLGYGTWYSYLLWQPLRLGAGIHAIFWLATALGWIVYIFVAACAADAVRSRQWLLPMVVLYTIALCLNWPHANARYLVPLVPLILLMIVRGSAILQTIARRRWQQLTWRSLATVGLASVVICNAALYAVDVSVMRSHHFYDRYEAGTYKSLIAAAQYLRDANIGNWQTCVNVEYKNLNKRRMSDTSLRILSMLTGKAMLKLPKEYTKLNLPRDREFRTKIINRNHVSYYLEQPPIEPWRVWHFRMGWLERRVTGEAPKDTGCEWTLYRCNGSEVPVQVPLPEVKLFPTRVPGF